MAWDSTKSAPSAQQPEPSTQCPIPGGYRRAETRHHRIDHPARLREDAQQPDMIARRCRGGRLTGAARAVSQAGGQAAQPLEVHDCPGRAPMGCAVGDWAFWLWGGVSLNTTRPRLTLAPGPSSHLPWASPGAPVSLALLPLPSHTPRPAACLHTSRRRTRRTRRSFVAALPRWDEEAAPENQR
jgi:hypothetical protein